MMNAILLPFQPKLLQPAIDSFQIRKEISKSVMSKIRHAVNFGRPERTYTIASLLDWWGLIILPARSTGAGYGGHVINMKVCSQHVKDDSAS
jgi:hypothetical protein